MKDEAILWTLAGHFALLSLFAIGGANAAIPEMHRLAVEVKGWMSERQFADLFAISQVAPGPNVIIVTLIGYQAAGIAGALVATVAMCGPSCIAAYYIGGVWDRFREARWRIAIQAGLVPITIGLIAASAWVLALAAVHNWIAAGITMATAIVGYFSKLNPLWLFAAAALIGLAGYV